jgi:hypothetical protein
MTQKTYGPFAFPCEVVADDDGKIVKIVKIVPVASEVAHAVLKIYGEGKASLTLDGGSPPGGRRDTTDYTKG